MDYMFLFFPVSDNNERLAFFVVFKKRWELDQVSLKQSQMKALFAQCTKTHGLHVLVLPKLTCINAGTSVDVNMCLNDPGPCGFQGPPVNPEGGWALPHGGWRRETDMKVERTHSLLSHPSLISGRREIVSLSLRCSPTVIFSKF